MDSKQLFRLFNSKYHLTNWHNEDGEPAQSESEVTWRYCGVGEEFRTETVDWIINKLFEDDEVYLCFGSNKSTLVPKSTLTDEIGKILHKKEVGIMNTALTKMLFFNSYGTFKSGVIRDFPESRTRLVGSPVKVAFHANIVDHRTSRIAAIIGKYLTNLEDMLHNDYGGEMEHLWIDLELLENSKPNSFRFQKRVAIPTSYTEFYAYNVGNYSVRPDFEVLMKLSSEDEISSYILEILYESTSVLLDKEKKIGDFDATRFRADFISACEGA
ncbi:hypothetical protein [Sphingobacterium tabacisoli]|uniref:Uncharacterized protein n=1 Tax=Sphingobacterium tabacisoli TaxID=2044855 RepID=A0ABW5L0T6_9SPHI|nr:hypothetical protein [Sphingobacterium tabacisoli]